MGNAEFKKLSENQAAWLERDVTIEEVHLAIFSSEDSKAPRPDGFNFNFYKKFWELMKHDIFTIVLEFFRRGHLPKGINTSYIALIPKVVGSSYFNDYRPISLLNGLYKIIAKILATRLKEVMQSVVNPT
jgi:hypothetical protein